MAVSSKVSGKQVLHIRMRGEGETDTGRWGGALLRLSASFVWERCLSAAWGVRFELGACA